MKLLIGLMLGMMAAAFVLPWSDGEVFPDPNNVVMMSHHEGYVNVLQQTPGRMTNTKVLLNDGKNDTIHWDGIKFVILDSLK